MSAEPITDEYEAWLVLAELIEGGRSMPEFSSYEECFGLCVCLSRMERYHLLDFDTRREMELRITGVPKRYDLYIYPEGHWYPRAKLCRRFAAAVLKEREAAR